MLSSSLPCELIGFCMYTRIARHRIPLERIPGPLRLFCFGHTPFRQRARRNSRRDAALDEKGPMCPGSNGPWEPRLSRGPIPRPGASAGPHVCAPTEQRGPGSPCENLTTASKPTKQLNSAQGKNPRPTSECAPVVILELQSAWELIRHVPVAHGSA